MTLRQFYTGRAIGLIVVLALVGGFFAFNSFIYNEKQGEPTPSYQPYRGTLTGTQVCLPHKNTSGPQTLECAIGMKTDSGEYYALDFSVMSQIPPNIPGGARFTATGLITPIENLSSDHWQKYSVQGIFSVTDSVIVESNDKPVSKEVTTFEECVLEGNPVMESYPRQCISKSGKHFTENVGNAVEKSDLIRLTSPLPNATVSSPITITGEARGNWYFEASFPIFLTDWDGKIIAQGIATAQGEWMTTEFVPFKATLKYNFADAGQYSNRGTLILKKDNPSGLPEHDDALEIPVMLK